MTALPAYKFDTPDGAQKMLDLGQNLSKQELIDKASYAVKQSGLILEIISTYLSDEQEAQLEEDYGAK